MVPAMVARRFAYWREPLCVLAALLYACNCFWWKPCTADPSAFVHCYLGDLLCLPVLMPVALWLHRRLRLRVHDDAPTAREWLAHWVLWSVCFEWFGPALPLLAPGAVRDPWDTVAYGVGGLLAALVWRGGRTPARPVPWRIRAGRWVGSFAISAAVAGFVLSAYRVGASVR